MLEYLDFELFISRAFETKFLLKSFLYLLIKLAYYLLLIAYIIMLILIVLNVHRILTIRCFCELIKIYQKKFYHWLL